MIYISYLDNNEIYINDKTDANCLIHAKLGMQSDTSKSIWIQMSYNATWVIISAICSVSPQMVNSTVLEPLVNICCL